MCLKPRSHKVCKYFDAFPTGDHAHIILQWNNWSSVFGY